MIAVRLGTFAILLLGIWVLAFISIGYSEAGKDFYTKVVSLFFFEDAAVPVMNLAIPFLLAGFLATVLMFQQNDKSISSASALPASLPGWIHRLYHRWRTSKGDLDCRRFTIYCICLPLFMMLIGNINRHLSEEDMSLDDQLMEIGNAFGFVALVAMSYFLIPVARQSPIIKFFQLNPVAAVVIHIWSGRIVIFAVAIHGAFHVYRWKALAGESIVHMIFPPAPCWSLSNDNDYTPECVDEDTDCDCYDLLRNLTGVTTLICLTIIGLTSLNYVRRTNYRLFYMVHVMVGPLTLFVVVLHWRKSMAYIAPSILYYIATSFPVITENQKCLSQDGVKLIKVERINCSNGGRPRHCMALTVKATPSAVSMYCSGQYVKLSAPSVCSISHPFTINRVPGSNEELRIVFRVMGMFTSRLCHQLTNPVNGALPKIVLDGFMGRQNRVRQVLMHDVAVMVAGGIGITPFLSVLEDVHTFLASSDSSVTKEVVLHWVCREQHLVHYVLKEYFEPLMSKPESKDFNLRIIVHKTPSLSNHDDDEPSDKEAQPVHSTGGSFCPSLYSAGSSCSTIHVLIATLTFSTVTCIGLWSVLVLYHRNNAKKEILYRAICPIFVVVLGLIISWLAKCLFPVSDRVEAMSLRLHDGVVFSRIEEDDHTLNDATDHRGALKVMREGSPNNTVTYEELDGARPTVHTLLKQLETARCPGLFICGPSSLMQDLKSAARERCSIRRCQCIAGDPDIAIYEEHFEM